MTSLEAALSAWIGFHAQLGVDMEAYLLPPATEAQIVEVEEVIGYRLPEDLRALYKIANGQWDMFNDDVLHAAPDRRWAPLFGHYSFLPLDKALKEYLSYLDMYASDKQFNEKYYAANPDKNYEPTVWEVREGDAVDPAGWNPNWFTFAWSDANGYSVDLSPPRGGSPGQVVLHGADEYILQVVGSSVTDLMEQAVIHLDADEEHRYQYEDRDAKYRANVFFNMDWRAELYVPQQQPELPAAYMEWMEEQEQARQRQREQLDVWLQGRDIDEQSRRRMLQWLDLRLIQNHGATPPMSVLMEMQMHLVAQGHIPDKSAISDQLSERVSSDSSKDALRGHAMNLASAYFVGDKMASGMGITEPIEDVINLYHQYKFETDDWNKTELNKINAFFGELKSLPIDSENGFHMSGDNQVLSICQSTFDEETYKSDEVCYDLDLSRF